MRCQAAVCCSCRAQHANSLFSGAQAGKVGADRSTLARQQLLCDGGDVCEG
jgi:hypothetical protein